MLANRRGAQNGDSSMARESRRKQSLRVATPSSGGIERLTRRRGLGAGAARRYRATSFREGGLRGVFSCQRSDRKNSAVHPAGGTGRSRRAATPHTPILPGTGGPGAPARRRRLRTSGPQARCLCHTGVAEGPPYNGASGLGVRSHEHWKYMLGILGGKLEREGCCALVKIGRKWQQMAGNRERDSGLGTRGSGIRERGPGLGAGGSGIRNDRRVEPVVRATTASRKGRSTGRSNRPRTPAARRVGARWTRRS